MSTLYTEDNCNRDRRNKRIDKQKMGLERERERKKKGGLKRPNDAEGGDRRRITAIGRRCCAVVAVAVITVDRKTSIMWIERERERERTNTVPLASGGSAAAATAVAGRTTEDRYVAHGSRD